MELTDEALAALDSVPLIWCRQLGLAVPQEELRDGQRGPRLLHSIGFVDSYSARRVYCVCGKTWQLGAPESGQAIAVWESFGALPAALVDALVHLGEYVPKLPDSPTPEGWRRVDG